MKRIRVQLTLSVDVELPDAAPLTAEEIQSHADWKLNEHSDGRQTFSTELMARGALDGVRWAVEEALFSKYASFPMFEHGARIEQRDALIARRSAEMLIHLTYGDTLKITVLPLNPNKE